MNETTVETRQETPALPGPERSSAREPLTDTERRLYLRAQTAALVIIALGGVLTLMYVARTVLVLTMVSVLLAFMLAPVVEFCHRMRIPRPVGSFLAVLLLCLAVYGVFHVSFAQANEVLDDLPKYSGRIRANLNQLRLRAERVRQTTRNVLPDDTSDRHALTVKQSPNWVEDLSNDARNVTEVMAMVAFVPFLVFFMLSWQEHVRASTVMLFSVENRHTAYTTIGLIAQMIRSFIVGNVFIGLILGVVSTIAFWILGVPYFYVIGIISGVVSLLPYLGIVLAVLPPVVVSVSTLTMPRFIAMVSVVAVSHLIALNVLYPKIIGSRLQLNPLAVTLALLFWGWLWGAMGLILAVPLTAAIKIICDHVESLKAFGDWMGA
ncbi:MAG: AI-2E family transporter [Acidobacteriota bacterium]|nr:AI-2E family transporter [Acidobacteriota bacterium]